MVLFMRHVDKDGPSCERYPDLGPCWIWTGSTKGPKWNGRNSYGQFNNGGKNHQAHRWLYEQLVGPIPPPLDLDHFACDNRWCVSPRHVRPVTRRENVLREFTGRGAGSKARQTHCKAGHPLSGANLKVNARGRDCHACCARRQREYLDRKAQRAAGIR
jgi:hypothetical protein